MRFRHLLSTLLLVSVTACGGTSKKATTDQGASATDATGPGQALPLDPAIKHGVLDNGLRYYIRPNRNPEQRGEFWLVVDAGSLYEADDQQGLAHFVEHMAFNGTEKFPKNQLVHQLQRLGVQFGAHLNAYTSFDETVYKLRVDTSKPEMVDLALEILSQWAGAITFDKEEIDAERGVVLAEKRMRSGAEQRVIEFLLGKVFGDNLYARRIPIGKPEILKNAPREALVRFYNDWYRPENMAVIAVGDFDVADIEKRLAGAFGDLKGSGDMPDRPQVALPDRSQPTYAAMSDAELPMSVMVVGRLLPARETRTEADLRRSLTENLALAMVTKRLEEKKQRGEASYLGAAGMATPLVRIADAFAFGAAVKPDEMVEGLDDMLEEIERVRRHGFTQSELDRAGSEMIAGIREAVTEDAAKRQPSDQLAAELVRHVTVGEAIAPRSRELAIVESVVAEAKPDQLAKLVGDLLTADDLIILAMSPKGATPPSREDALAVLSGLPQKQLTAYADVKSDQPLLEPQPTAGKVVEKKHHAEIDVHEWKLSNGARVVLKPTQFREDQVLLRASSPGGHSLSGVKELHKTMSADQLVRLGGLGEFDSIALEKALAGRRVGVSPFIDELEEGINAWSSKDDLETMLQMVHLSFTAPRKDPKAFEVWRSTTLEQIRLSMNKPEIRFVYKLAPLNDNNNPRRVEWTEEAVMAFDLDASYELYKERLADASDFTFYLVGSFDPAAIEPLVNTYLASLPDIERKESYKVHTWPAHKKLKRLEVKDGNEPRANLSFYYRKPIKRKQITRVDEVAWPLFADALEMQLLDLFREKMGDTYTVSVSVGFQGLWSSADLRVTFQCAPERATELEQLARQEIAKAVTKGLADGYLEKAKNGALNQLGTLLTDNSYWRNRLNFVYFNDRPLGEITGRKALIDKVDDKAISRVTRMFVNAKAPVVGVLLPTDQAESASGAAAPR